MADHLIHTTGQNERWDHLAEEYYGDGKLTAPIMKANPEVIGVSPAPLVLPKGLDLRIPILTAAEAGKTQLPPWKKDDDG